MNYLNLSSIQKYDIFFTTILFSIFILTLKPLILTGKIISRDIIAFSLIFFCFMGLTTILTNSISFSRIFNKLQSENI
jgi:hypothetical protein